MVHGHCIFPSEVAALKIPIHHKSAVIV
jgi:hypothetical protein